MSPHLALSVTITCLLALLLSQSAYALRCDGELVSKGDSKISVQKKCGSPSWSDRWREEITNLPESDFEHRIIRTNERWVYNPGPNQFLRFITFRDGNVVHVETGGRGFTMTPDIQQRCDFGLLSLGTNSAEVATKCGEADWKEQYYETVTQPISGGRRAISVAIDEWTFNLGPTRFIRILTFRNGSLVDIRTGERGFKQ